MEHGSHPWNTRPQHTYLRRRFIEDIAVAFEKFGTVVPIFKDQHLGPEWPDALWMDQRARQLKIPFTAGASMPVGFRFLDRTLPAAIGCATSVWKALGSPPVVYDAR